MDIPCKDCEERTSECHATCKRYARYAKAREVQRNAKAKRKALERAATSSAKKLQAYEAKIKRRGKR